MREYKIITYLSFNGNCEEAINAYIEAFGGKILYLSRWDEQNSEKEEQVGKVMHAEFQLGETSMAAGDTFEEEHPNSGTKLMVHMETKEEALKSIDILKKGGKLLSALAPHPEPDDGGMGCLLTDRYGFTWILTCPNPQKQINT